MRCPPSSTSLPGRQRGVALVVALLVFALSAVLMVGMHSEFNLFHQRTANHLLVEQGDAYLRGAEELATLALLADADADQARGGPRDDLSEIWAREPTPYPLDEGGWLMGGLQDLQGRFNLNLLVASAGEDATGEPGFTAAQQLFIRLLQSLGDAALPRDQAIAVTLAVGDWLDPDDLPRVQGAEDDGYLSLTPAYRAANRPMASVSELRAVAGVTPELFEALQPLVTVWPRQASEATLNIHTAPLPVLQALNADDSLEPLGEAEARQLYTRQREEGGFADLQAFRDSTVFADQSIDDLENLLGESSSWFLLSAEVEVAGRRLRLYSVLHRDGRSVRAMTRAYGSP